MGSHGGALERTPQKAGLKSSLASDGGGSRGQGRVTVADSSGGERRELFGFRRTVKATATGLFRAFHPSDDYPRSAGGGSGRMLRRGDSIVASTEAFTETALAAKNEELRALAAKNDDLERVLSARVVPGLREVLQLLSHATEAHAAAHTSDTHLSSSHRALLNAALQAQASLHSLLQEHGGALGVEAYGGGGGGGGGGLGNGGGAGGAGGGGGARGGSQQPAMPQMQSATAPQPSYRAKAPTCIRAASDYADPRGGVGASPVDAPGLAPSGVAPSRGLHAPSSLMSEAAGGLDRDRAAEASATLTWTSALGVSDVHERLYAETGDRAADPVPLVD